MTLAIGSLFSGYGGLDMGVSSVLDARTVWHVENDPAPSAILRHNHPGIPNHGDITAVDWDSVEPVDILTGGFPCQDVSLAGARAGLRAGTRSGLWAHFAAGIDALRPSLVIIENVRGLLSAEAHSEVEPCPWCLGDGASQCALRALGAVLGDLATLGYDARWCGLRASDAGAPHSRFRVFIAAHPANFRHERGGVARHGWGGPSHRDQSPADTGGDGREGLSHVVRGSRGAGATAGNRPVDWGRYGPAIERWAGVVGRVAPYPTELSPNGNPRLSAAFDEWMMGLPEGTVTDPDIGISYRAQIRACGNGVVPQQAALAVRRLLG